MKKKIYLLFILFFLAAFSIYSSFFSDYFLLLGDIEKVTRLRTSLRGKKTFPEFKDFLLKNEIQIQKLPEDSLHGLFLQETQDDTAATKEFRELNNSNPNSVVFCQRLIGFLRKEATEPEIKFRSILCLLKKTKNVGNRSILIRLALHLNLTQTLPVSPFTFSEIYILFPDIETLILSERDANSNIMDLKKIFLANLQKIETIPLVSAGFKDIFFFTCFFRYFVFLCEPTKENAKSLSASIDRCIFLSKNFISIRGLLKSRGTKSIYLDEYLRQLAFILGQCQKLKLNFVSVGSNPILSKDITNETPGEIGAALDLSFVLPKISLQGY